MMKDQERSSRRNFERMFPIAGNNKCMARFLSQQKCYSSMRDAQIKPSGSQLKVLSVVWSFPLSIKASQSDRNVCAVITSAISASHYDF